MLNKIRHDRNFWHIYSTEKQDILQFYSALNRINMTGTFGIFTEQKNKIIFLGFSRVRLLKVDVPLKVPEDAKNLEVRHQVPVQ